MFKISLLTFKTLQLEQPSYLRSILSVAMLDRSLRSNQGTLLTVPRVKTVTGSRAFSYCAPSLWNSLPLSVRSSQSVLRRTFSAWPFPHNVAVTRLLVDELELNYDLCILITGLASALELGFAEDTGTIEDITHCIVFLGGE